MVEQLEVLERMVAAVLAAEQNPTGEFIRETIDSLRESPIASGVGDEAAEQLARRFEERVSITQHLGSGPDGTRVSPMAGRRQGTDRPVLLGSVQAIPHTAGLPGECGEYAGLGHRPGPRPVAGSIDRGALGPPWDGRRSRTVGQDRELHRTHLQGRRCRLQAESSSSLASTTTSVARPRCVSTRDS